jgi:hypothetical protein
MPHSITVTEQNCSLKRRRQTDAMGPIRDRRQPASSSAMSVMRRKVRCLLSPAVVLRQQSRRPVCSQRLCLVPLPCCFLGQHQAGVETGSEVVRLSPHSSQRGRPFPAGRAAHVRYCIRRRCLSLTLISKRSGTDLRRSCAVGMKRSGLWPILRSRRSCGGFTHRRLKPADHSPGQKSR